MPMKFKTILAVMALSFGAISTANSSTTLTNSPAWNGTSGFIYFGTSPYAAPTEGQIVTIPTADALLQSFTFYLSNQGSPAQTYQAYVQYWDEAAFRPAGPVLYTATGIAPSSPGAYISQTFTPNITLTPNAKVILYFSTLGITTNALADYGFGFGATDASSSTYSGGESVSSFAGKGSANTTSPDILTSSTWYGFSSKADAAFTANFVAVSSVPELSPVQLMLVSFVIFAAQPLVRKIAIGRRLVHRT